MLRSKILAAAKVTGVTVHDGGCYGATQGPRLEPSLKSPACAATAATWWA